MGCGASGSTLKENSAAQPTLDAGNKEAPASASTCHAEDATKHKDHPKPAAAGSETPQPCPAEPPAVQSLPDQSYVLITGIERRPELNGQAGIVVSFEISDRRYTVRVGDALLSLRESKLTLLSEMEYLQASTAVRSDAGNTLIGEHLVDSVISECSGGLPQTTSTSAAPTTPPPPPAGAYSMEAKLQEYEALPLGTLTARGALVPTYSWVKVPDVATLPPGMEVWMPLVGLKCARIPTTWRLQIVAEGTVDSYRCDVGQHTPLTELRRGAATAFGWDEHSTEIRADGGSLAEMADASATVGSASLFGKKVTALRTR